MVYIHKGLNARSPSYYLLLCCLQVVFEIIGDQDTQLKKKNHNNLTHVHGDGIKLLIIQIFNITTREENMRVFNTF